MDEAIEQYTMAIRLAPEDPTAYTNRAFAYIKTERYASAEADCIAALKLDQKSIKALFRIVCDMSVNKDTVVFVLIQ
ncbi:unnamed protein product [Trichobilharzia regenti]|nr:unnamed protein product [Trichobilharzia regenti]